jgi:competence protein ComEA
MIEWFRLNLRKCFPVPLFLAALPLPAQNLPEGPGKAALQTVCVKCHDLNQVIARRRTAVDWSMTVDKMVTQGAEGTETQFSDILDYLIANFRKPINVNQATAKSLEAELELTTKEAEAIVAYRDQNAPFKSLEDLKRVPGVDPKKLDAAKDWVAF